MGHVLEFHSGIALNKEQTLCWACPQPDCNDISMYALGMETGTERRITLKILTL